MARAIARRSALLRAAVADGVARASCCAACRGRSSTAVRAPKPRARKPRHAGVSASSRANVDWAGVAHALAASRCASRVSCRASPSSCSRSASATASSRAPASASIRARRARCRRSAAPRIPTSRRCARSRRRISSSTSTRTGARTSTPRARSCRTSSSRIRWRPPTTSRCSRCSARSSTARTRADALAPRLRTRRSQSVEARDARLARERVLYLIWRKPWMTVSRETYVSATLALVGWDTRARAARPRAIRRRRRRRGVARRAAHPALHGAVCVSRARRARRSRAPRRSPCALVDGEWTSWYGVRAIAGCARCDIARLAAQ